MRVEQLPGLRAGEAACLRAAGISNCRQLLRAGHRPEALRELSKTTGLSIMRLRDIVQRAGLGQIRGVGPVNLGYLVAIGVDSLAALAVQETEALQSQLQQVVTPAPNLAVIECWIEQARHKKGRRSDPSTLW